MNFQNKSLHVKFTLIDLKLRNCWPHCVDQIHQIHQRLTEFFEQSNYSAVSLPLILCLILLISAKNKWVQYARQLVEKQESGELARDIEIPEVSSINNWIARFAVKSKKNLSEQAIASF
ncbi:unnamed protein product [Rhizophagus irregularis]|nr:unnamed protein product [Rhizophagus irregularis]